RPARLASERRAGSGGAAAGAPGWSAVTIRSAAESFPLPPRPVAGFPIGLIALDLDGTLIDDDLVLRPRTVAAIRSARERGVAVSIVTGRMTTSALPFARELGLVDPIVAYQG